MVGFGSSFIGGPCDVKEWLCFAMTLFLKPDMTQASQNNEDLVT